MSSNSHYILSINCGSSSIKAKLFQLEGKGRIVEQVADLSVKNITSKGEKVKFKITWEKEGLGKDVDDDGEDGAEVDYKKLPPQLLEKLDSCSKIHTDQITHITHRIVHGASHAEPIMITKDHTQGLEDMDVLSEFAPLHNHLAVLAVRSCLEALPNHTSVLLFDTMFHHTLPKEVYTYAIPSAGHETKIPLRKYGFHGLSYMSILGSMATKLGKKKDDVNIVVAHLGSGGSVCCIKNGKSIDTSMGLTPLEGLVGGTRSGSIDPVVVFHLVKGCAEDAGLPGMKVTNAEAVLNKKSGLQALAGTSNFGIVTQRMTNPSSCSKEEHESSSLAYAVYVDRLMGYLMNYLSKLFSSGVEVDGLVFSGGIGEKSDHLRADVAKRLGWLGVKVDEGRNRKASAGMETVTKISEEGSKLPMWVVLTDEEKVCAEMCRDACGL